MGTQGCCNYRPWGSTGISRSKERQRGGDIKIIYGVEGYLLDDRDLQPPDGTIDYKKKGTNHVIIIAKTQKRIENLYKLVSLSHIDYFYRKPRIPKSL